MQNKRQGKDRAARLFLFGIMFLLASAAVNAASLVDSIDKMINSGNSGSMFLGRLIITALLCLPLFIMHTYTIRVWGKFSTTLVMIIYAVFMLYASSNVKSLGVASWTAWLITLAVGALAFIRGRDENLMYSSGIKKNPITIGLMIGLISLVVAPFNSLLSGASFPSFVGKADMLKLFFNSPLMWPLVGVIVGTVAMVLPKMNIKPSKIDSIIEERIPQLNANVEQQIDHIEKAANLNTQEGAAVNDMDSKMDEIDDELDKGMPNNAQILEDVQKITDDANRVGRYSAANVVNVPSLNEALLLPESVLKHDEELIRAVVGALRSKNVDSMDKSGIEKGEDYLNKLVKSISDEKKTGFWKDYQSMEEENFKGVVDSLRESNVELLERFAESLEKSPKKYKNISKFLAIVKEWRDELAKQKDGIKKEVKAASKSMLNKEGLIKRSIVNIQQTVNDIETRKRAIIAGEKAYSLNKKQVLDYIGITANTYYTNQDRKRTVQALKQRIDSMAKFHDNKNSELKEIAKLMADVKQLVAALPKLIKSNDEERKILQDMMERDIGAKKSKTIVLDLAQEIKKRMEKKEGKGGIIPSGAGAAVHA